jgi:hypothetical protein
VAIPAEPPALAHLEKTLADSYRKEVDQEENIWRSLPFFAATLALQLAALFQLLDRLPPIGTWPGAAALALLAVSGLCSLVALSFLAASIYPARFLYIAEDAALLEYGLDLITDEMSPSDQAGDGAMSAIVTLKGTLARQYAVATDHNRRINKGRERRRSIAGLATIAAVLSTLVLVAATFLYYIQNHPPKGSANGPAQPRSEASVSAGHAGPVDSPAFAGGPADAGCHQGMVGSARRESHRRRA